MCKSRDVIFYVILKKILVGAVDNASKRLQEIRLGRIKFVSSHGLN